MRIEDAIKVVDRMLERNRINKDGRKRALAENKRKKSVLCTRQIEKNADHIAALGTRQTEKKL